MDVKEIFMHDKYMVPLCIFQQLFFSEFVFQFPRDLTLSHILVHAGYIPVHAGYINSKSGPLVRSK